MNEIDTLEGEWQDLAIDNGDIVLEANEYYAELDDGNNVISTQITNISYSPAVNKAKNLKIDVPADSVLEDNTYLGQTLRVYVDNNLLFQGKVLKISTSKTEGEDYTLEARPPGKKLKGEDIDTSISNEPIYDTIASVVDKYNTYDAEHSDLRGTSDEELYNIEELGLDVLGVNNTNNTGDILYKNVGTNVSEIDTIYVKTYTPGSDNVTIKIRSGNNTEQVSISDSDLNKYGEWTTVKPAFSSDTSGYEIQFTLEGSARLINWISITDHQIQRDVTLPDVSFTDENPNGNEQNFYSFNKSELAKKANRVDDGVIVNDEEGNEEIRTRKVSQWASLGLSEKLQYDDVDEREQGTGTQTTNEAIDKEAFILDRGEKTPDLSYHFANDFDKLQDYGFNLRIRIEEDYGPDTDGLEEGNQTSNEDGISDWRAQIKINNRTNKLFRERKISDTFSWINIAPGFLFRNLDSVDELVIKTRQDSDVAVVIDAIVLCHKQNELDYTFDNTLNGNNEITRPARYAHSGLYGERQYVEFEAQNSDRNISSATTNVTYSGTDSIGDYGVEHSLALTPTEGYTSKASDNSSVSDNFVYPGSSHSFRVALSSLKDSDTPTEGGKKQSLESVDVDVVLNDLSIFSDENLDDNRLAVVNSLCKNSKALCRFDGSSVKIFPRGKLKTNVSLYKEDVTSSRDISEAYKSCKVKGKNDAEGNRIVSQDAPDYVTAKKTINSREIKSVEEANAKARSFLEEHGDIEYTGKISTLPTFAPIGELMDGSNFNHGKDMTIESVRYGKRRTKISLGFTEDIANQLVETAEAIHNINKEGTSKGMTAPTGTNEYSERGGN